MTPHYWRRLVASLILPVPRRAHDHGRPRPRHRGAEALAPDQVERQEGGYLSAAYTEQRSEYGLPGHSHGYESCQPHASSLHCDGHDQPGPIGGWRATCSKPWRATLAKIYAPNCTS